MENGLKRNKYRNGKVKDEQMGLSWPGVMTMTQKSG